MKRTNKSFTLIEMMMVLGIVAILFGIGTAVFTIATGKSEIAKAKSEIAQLTAAIEMYYDRWGQYPVPAASPGDTVNEEFNFGEWLSKVAPVAGLSNWQGKRPMFIKYNEQGYDVDNTDYDAQVASATVIYDPWGTPYGYSYDAGTKSFIVYSVGTYEMDGKKLSASWSTNYWKFEADSSEITNPASEGLISNHLK